MRVLLGILHCLDGLASPREWRRPTLLAADDQGSALIEAALVFPILLTLFLGVSEFSEAFIVSRRLAIAANTAADLVARVKTVSTADLNGLKSMIDETIKPYSTTSFGLIITSVVADGNTPPTNKVAWSYAQGAGVTAHAAGSVITMPDNLTPANTSIIYAEVKYTFRSTLSSLIAGDVPMQAVGYQTPRFAMQVAKSD
jgi:Flp pilus assembly protein TadG